MCKSLAFIFVIVLSTLAYAYPNYSDEEIKNILIQQSISSYISTIGNCPCPYNKDRAGKACGGRSAWARKGGYSPLCYPSDITQDMILKYQNEKFNKHLEMDSAPGATDIDNRDKGPLIGNDNGGEK